jgi:NAD(P)-dependent dehydrogenase (short-subunit alcohol dehydrogenase family)
MSGEIVLITGGTSAIGRAAAEALAAEGAAVVLSGRDAGRAQTCVQAVRAAGGSIEFIKADVCSAEDVGRLVQTTLDRHGRLDYAFNNAGGTGDVRGALVDFEEADWDRVIDINLRSLWLCLRAELRAMRVLGRGSIVNTIGALGIEAAPNLSAYVAAKHAAVGLTKAAALEEARNGIRVNGVAPGMTVRDEPAELAASRARRASEAVPMGRLATAREIGNAVAWLCSDRASFVTGHILAVDGGWLPAI